MVFACLAFTTPKESYAGVMSVDDIGGFGDGALTRDTDQLLDFLELTHTTSMSIAGRESRNDDERGFRRLPSGDI